MGSVYLLMVPATARVRQARIPTTHRHECSEVMWHLYHSSRRGGSRTGMGTRDSIVDAARIRNAEDRRSRAPGHRRTRYRLPYMSCRLANTLEHHLAYRWVL